jgi:hypothetical protein
LKPGRRGPPRCPPTVAWLEPASAAGNPDLPLAFHPGTTGVLRTVDPVNGAWPSPPRVKRTVFNEQVGGIVQNSGPAGRFPPNRHDAQRPGDQHAQLRSTPEILDELHTWVGLKGQKLWASPITGQGARAQPLTLITTTVPDEAPKEGDVFLDQLGYAQKVAGGEIDDRRYLPMLWLPP